MGTDRGCDSLRNTLCDCLASHGESAAGARAYSSTNSTPFYERTSKHWVSASSVRRLRRRKGGPERCSCACEGLTSRYVVISISYGTSSFGGGSCRRDLGRPALLAQVPPKPIQLATRGKLPFAHSGMPTSKMTPRQLLGSQGRILCAIRHCTGPHIVRSVAHEEAEARHDYCAMPLFFPAAYIARRRWRTRVRTAAETPVASERTMGAAAFRPDTLQVIGVLCT